MLMSFLRISMTPGKRGIPWTGRSTRKNVHCVAMPVFDYRGRIIAAASVTGFSEKVYEREGLEARAALKITCDAISKRLGYLQADHWTDSVQSPQY